MKMDLRAQQELRDAAESAAKQEELAALQLKQLEEAAAAAMERRASICPCYVPKS